MNNGEQTKLILEALAAQSDKAFSLDELQARCNDMSTPLSRKRLKRLLRPGGPLLRKAHVHCDDQGYWKITSEGLARLSALNTASALIAPVTDTPRGSSEERDAPNPESEVSDRFSPTKQERETTLETSVSSDVFTETPTNTNTPILTQIDKEFADRADLDAPTEVPLAVAEHLADEPSVEPTAKDPVAGKRHSRFVWTAVAAVMALAFGSVALWEIRNSRLQAWYFSHLARDLTFKVEPGTSQDIRFPLNGPFDIRNGYTQLPAFIDRLQKRGFHIDAQARMSPRQLALFDEGFYPIYREKTQTGLTIFGSDDKPIYRANHGERTYADFSAIPDLVVKTLLFIENQELLDQRHPFRNPVIEWDRLGYAAVNLALETFLGDRSIQGGSTLATQLEKYRHSPEGRTASVGEKLRQMVSASLRAYQDGPNTMASRRRIVTDYINSVPLASRSGVGEVIGLGDGLKAWHNASFSEVNRLLASGEGSVSDGDLYAQRALAYKQVLSLFIAQRRPALYLQNNRGALRTLTDTYLKLLARGGIISQNFCAAALAAHLEFADTPPSLANASSFFERKGAMSSRIDLSRLLGVDRLYALDRLDMTAQSTINVDVQKDVAATLQHLRDPAFAKAMGFNEPHLLSRGDPSQIVYSFTLLEHVGTQNLLRVQTDNVDGPFNMNEGGKLELGSTAKLRTLVTYLEIIQDLHDQLVDLDPAKLAALKPVPNDRLSQWAIAYVRKAKTAPASLRPTNDKSDEDADGAAQDDDEAKSQTSQVLEDPLSLHAMLTAAMQRVYSANPTESFFTGGGLMRYNNFEHKEDGEWYTVADGLQQSVNLVFVRLMRDLVNYYEAQIPDAYALTSGTMPLHDPRRMAYLARFADMEGRDFLGRFYEKYDGLNADEALEQIARTQPVTARRLAAIYRTVRPLGSLADLKAFIQAHIPHISLSDRSYSWLYEAFAPGKYSLSDRGFIARIHPLELWLVTYMQSHPDADYSEIMEASREQRQEVYAWLFNTNSRHKQDMRIAEVLERDAFKSIHARWKRVGYPFDHLVASLGSALGSSGDRPAALADLMGIILNGGKRYATVSVEKLNFAQGTPFETSLSRESHPGEQLLSPVLASVVHDALVRVVQGGTAERVRNAFVDKAGNPITVGGKTGTGDNRYDVFDETGREVVSKTVNRTATFVFYLGDRFFGTVVAYVPDASGGNYRFTSALPVHLLKVLAPALKPLLDGAPNAIAKDVRSEGVTAH